MFIHHYYILWLGSGAVGLTEGRSAALRRFYAPWLYTGFREGPILLGNRVNRGKLFGQIAHCRTHEHRCTLSIVEIRSEGIALCPSQSVGLGQAITEAACAPMGKAANSITSYLFSAH